MAKFIGIFVVLLLEKEKINIMKAENGLKRCSKCMEVKGVEEFSKNKQASDNLTCDCKKCRKVIHDEWRKKNIEKSRSDSRRWRDNNLEKARSASLLYNSNNRDRISTNSSRWYNNNRMNVLEKQKLNRSHINQINMDSSRQLLDWYVKKVLSINFGIKFSDATNKMIELKRTQLINKRLIKNLKENETK